MNVQPVCLLVLVALSASFLSTEACDCVPPERQHRNVGCKGEFIAIVTVTGSTRKDEMELNLPFKLIQDGTPSLPERQSIVHYPYLATAENSALCGVYLEVNSTYLIKGGLSNALQLNSCNSYIKKLNHIPDKQEGDSLIADLVKRIC